MKRFALLAVISLLSTLTFGSEAKAATGDTSPSFTVGVGVKASTLGAGIDFAVPVTRRSNVRVGVNGLNYNRTFDKDNVSYRGRLALRSFQATYDFFPFAGSFHISPGMLAYNGTKVTATASVPGGQDFDLGDATYRSSNQDPLKGNANLSVNKAAPMVLLGFGNLVPRRRSRHLTASFEVGAFYQGTPKVGLNFGGSACDITGLNCREIAGDPSIQTEVLKEQEKLNKDVSPFKFYPVVSFGFGYKF